MSSGGVCGYSGIAGVTAIRKAMQNDAYLNWRMTLNDFTVK